MWKLKKIQYDFTALHATIWANSPFAGSLSPWDPYVIMLYWFLDIEFFRINRVWLHKDLEGWDFQQIGELAQATAYRAVKSETLGLFPSRYV